MQPSIYQELLDEETAKIDMNILILNASPRRKGNISTMLDAMEKEALQRGTHVDMIHVADLQVKACTGCMACRSRQACVLPDDDAQRIVEMIKTCDVLIIGSPCYWGNMPGQLKVLFDRMVYAMMGETPRGLPQPLHKGKRAIVVSTCTTSYPFNILFNQSRGTVKALKEILKWSGFRIKAVVERGGTKETPVGPKDLVRCRKAIQKVL